MSRRAKGWLGAAVGLVIVLAVAAGLAVAQVGSSGSSGPDRSSRSPVPARSSAATARTRVADKARSEPAFCTTGAAHDFGRAALPPVRELPANDEAGAEIGHPAVSIHGEDAFVQPRPGKVGYRFYSRSLAGPLDLNWEVSARLWSITPRGASRAEVAHTAIKIAQLGENQPVIALKLPSRLGFYRLDLRIAEAGGKTLGSWSQYFRRARPSWDVHLALNRRAAHPGQKLFFRLETSGSEWAYFGENYEVQRLQGGAWRYARGLNAEGFEDVGLAIPGGSAGGCEEQSIPAGTPPGRYRIVKEVSPSPTTPRRKADHPRVAFRILSN